MPLCPLSPEQLDMISGMLNQVQLVALSVVIRVSDSGHKKYEWTVAV